MTSSKIQIKIMIFLKTSVPLKLFYTKKKISRLKMMNTTLKEHNLSFQKIYSKSQISFSIFEKITFKVWHFFAFFYEKITKTVQPNLKLWVMLRSF